ncbi:MAG: hypothetical protein WBX38_04205 [Candidatus Sulfotelmatobacter sp.]
MRAKKLFAASALIVASVLLIGTMFVAAQDVNSDKVTSTVIPANFFDMSAHDGVLYSTPWPTMKPYGMRLWEAHTGWGQINTAKGVYDWSTLDDWTGKAATNNAQLIYTFGYTPKWASSKSNDSSCDHADGSCDPPDDLNSDGTGTDQHFIDFVTAIAKHAPSITYWELWNTPHDIKQWTGTNAQLVRMAKDANTYIKKYIPSAKIISMANGQLNYTYPDANCTMADKMGGYLAAGLTPYIDIVGFHTYYTTTAEDIVPVIQCYQSTMDTYGIGSLPIWSTEGAWGNNSDLSTTDQANYLARSLLLLWSNGVARHYWYDWNDPEFGTLESNGKINNAGSTYDEVQSWMLGRTMNTLCSKSSSSGIWTCGFSGSKGYAAQAVWHPGGNKTYTAPNEYVNYLNLSGKKTTISKGAKITVGDAPVLLQNQ